MAQITRLNYFSTLCMPVQVTSQLYLVNLHTRIQIQERQRHRMRCDTLHRKEIHNTSARRIYKGNKLSLFVDSEQEHKINFFSYFL